MGPYIRAKGYIFKTGDSRYADIDNVKRVYTDGV